MKRLLLCTISALVFACSSRAPDTSGNQVNQMNPSRASPSATAPGAVVAASDDQTNTSDEDVAFSAEYEKCTDGLARRDTMDCAVAELERQDAKLNQAYQSVVRRLTPAEQSVLRGKERQWIRERDDKCEKESTEGFGPVALNDVECRVAETIRRTSWLTKYTP